MWYSVERLTELYVSIFVFIQNIVYYNISYFKITKIVFIFLHLMIKKSFLSMFLCCSDLCVHACAAHCVSTRTHACLTGTGARGGVCPCLCVKNRRMRSTRPKTRTGSVRPQRLQIFPVSRGERGGQEVERTAGRDGSTVIPGEGWTDGLIQRTEPRRFSLDPTSSTVFRSEARGTTL